MLLEKEALQYTSGFGSGCPGLGCATTADGSRCGGGVAPRPGRWRQPWYLVCGGANGKFRNSLSLELKTTAGPPTSRPGLKREQAGGNHITGLTRFACYKAKKVGPFARSTS
jgi:hypothetical protein